MRIINSITCSDMKVSVNHCIKFGYDLHINTIIVVVVWIVFHAVIQGFGGM